MTIDKDSIILVLDNQLELYSLDSVNYHIELMDQILTDKRLELYRDFDTFWQKNWKAIESILSNKGLNNHQVYFVTAPNAGFTNTRIVYLWLQSLLQFWKPDLSLGFVRITNFNNFNNLESKQLENLLKLTTADLNYSQEPRIGQKNTPE